MLEEKNIGTVFLICGKICSGKSYYAKRLKEQYNAVILSTDEVTFELINNEQGEFYNVFAERVNNYLRKKAVEICKAGSNVILDWGFWSKNNRLDISQYLDNNGVPFEWHYIDVSDDIWKKNIEERNRRITEGGGGSDFFVDEGLIKKSLDLFEIPGREEMNIWYRQRR